MAQDDLPFGAAGGFGDACAQSGLPARFGFRMAQALLRVGRIRGYGWRVAHGDTSLRQAVGPVPDQEQAAVFHGNRGGFAGKVVADP